MHVVDITMFYASEGGGITTYLNAKADWLVRRRMRHTILSPNLPGPNLNANVDWTAAPNLQGLSGIGCPGFHGYRMPRSIAGPARAIEQLRPDLVESGDAAQSAWAALRAARRLDVPAVAFYHSDLHGMVAQSWGRATAAAAAHYLRQLYRRFDLVLAPSKIMQAHLHALGLPDAQQQALGVDCAIFSPARRDGALRATLGLAPETRLLIYAGRYTPQKKLPVLAAAVARLGHPYHLLLVGSGGAPPRGPRLTVLPFQRDQRALARLLASCDLLVHPGDQETFGLIAIEAMACGLPVLGTGGGVAELLDAGTGLQVRPDSVDSLCQGIEALFQCDLAALGANARHKAQAQYDWNRIMPQLMARYAGLLASRRHPETDAASRLVRE